MTIHTHTHTHHALLCLAMFLLTFPSAAQLTSAPPPPPTDPFARLKFDRNMAIVMVILVIVFFILGFLSIYTRQCAERRMRGGRLDLSLPIVMSGRRPRGLDADIIDTFPTFVYSSIKGLKMGSTSLECAVCLNEFQDDETLRLIPTCSHVFHPECIDLWLSSHSTCPLCRANLIPKPGDSSFVAVQISHPQSDSPQPLDLREENTSMVEQESPILTARSKSTGFRLTRLFPRSHSTGHSLLVHQEGENWERFTLRISEDARKDLLLKRTNSCGVFTRERSKRRGFRTRSVGRNYFQYERFMRSDSTVVNRGPVGPSGADMDDTGELSSDPLFPAGNKGQVVG